MIPKNEKFARLVRDLNPLDLTLRPRADGTVVGGYGHVFAAGSGLTFEAAEALAQADHDKCAAELDHAVQLGLLPQGLCEIRRAAIMLVFWCHGCRIPAGHAQFFLDVKLGHWRSAGDHLTGLPYHIATPVRQMLFTGSWPEL